MNGVQIVNAVVWTIGIGLLLWMVVDALRVEVHYDRDLLVSAGEGEIEKEPIGAFDREAWDDRGRG